MNDPHLLRKAAIALALVILSGDPVDGAAADSAQLELLKQGAPEWNAMRRRDPALRPDLSGAGLLGRRLRLVDFSYANLSGIDLRQSDLLRSDLHGAALKGALLDATVLAGSTLAGADMTGSSLTDASCPGADFSGSRLASSSLRRADLSRASLNGADLRGADLRESNLEYVDLRGADLRGANLWRARHGQAKTYGARVSGETVLFSGKAATPESALEGGMVFDRPPAPALPVQSEAPGSAWAVRGPADDTAPMKAWLRKPHDAPYDAVQVEALKRDVFAWNRMRKSDASMAVNLREADLSGKNLAYASLDGADLRGSTLRMADLSGSTLYGATLQGSDLRAANLLKADLRKADLRGANLWRANIGRALFDGAVVSPATVLDNGSRASAEWANRHRAVFVVDDDQSK